ncbi:small conductance calcium-activated potassium channel protein-like [Ruditapes philippinarum]|uniref:small conductance calcium-activated potassium channel protein-like n=1 Tax=Ruditapes philippinarum TaxID=129788 RepID=UPI00295AACAA|nr:small conductance calcium-activated potassium channel protein-like [Ruditapes philippinarum]XP_060553332.1 small conductance calcium-activated potassium channel protein-like [Ruditapes philippinarum]XP_060553333.1 small conductance calcium-activated potassium channel protein-like [Ruditapes philippinarum]XP_060553334.1 small conductance calcium-activated potassium channel protein-like [Ruditapes philippinarum]XP_060553335.1 small conductance calcium-activated potassium channel protein-like [
MESPDLPLVNGNWQYPSYVSTDNVSTQNLIMPGGKRESVLDTKNLGYRLRVRKELIGRRTRVSDMAFVLAILGIIITIIDTECQFAQAYNSFKPISVYLRVITTITTLGLLVTIIMYHLIGIKLRLISQGLSNWKLVTDWKDLVKLITELIVCAIHPMPFTTAAALPMYVSSVSSDELHAFTVEMFPLNSIFTILMFMRVYLLMRFLVVHSALFCDTTVQSLGAMSNVNINAQFVFKALMSIYPGTCLVSIMCIVLLVNSYSVRMCEHYTLDDHAETFFMQAIWMTCVTFLTLGYGDVVPRTTCGRVLAIFTGMMGVGLMALCVAVLTRKLEQTRGEKYVHTFVQQIKMDKKYKNAAAKVVTEFLTICRLRRRNVDAADDRYIIHKRRLIHAVRSMNHARYLRMQVGESLTGPVEINKNVTEIYDMVETVRDDQDTLKSRITGMEDLMCSMHEQLKEIKTMMTKSSQGSISRPTTPVSSPRTSVVSSAEESKS